MNGRGKIFVTVVASLTLAGAAAGLRGASPGPLSIEANGENAGALTPELRTATHGLNLLMNGDPNASIQVFRQIEEAYPDSALGYLLDADAVWWKIYLTTGNLVDPDVFDVVSSGTTPYDSHFNDLVRVTIQKARRAIRNGHDVARNYLYEGMAYALRARLAGLEGKELPTARAGKKMRSLLLIALQKDPSLTDADLGIGIYNYFVDTLPGIIKLLRWLIGLPGGNRELGLQQLRLAAQHGVLTRGEAQFYLAKDFSRSSERHYGRSLKLFQSLSENYPRNPLWKLLTGGLEIRLGRRDQGEALYRQAFEMTRGEKTATGRSLHQAARQAIERMHPGGTME
jgi:tetratricopeptide (TPR) repeat protein